MIVLIGSHEDHRCGAVINALLARQARFALFSTLDFPYHASFSIGLDDPPDGWLYTPGLDAPVALAHIRAVYYCVNQQFALLPDEDPALEGVIYNNIDSAVWGFFRALDCKFINPIDPANLHNYKALLLRRFRRAGLRVPNTVVTNQPEAIVRFYEDNRQSVVCKPPWGQAFTERLTPEHLQPEMLARLAHSPVMLQEYIPGRDYRVYVLEEQAFGVEIRSETLDLNLQGDAERVAVDLPESLLDDCRQVAAVAGLPFTAIDFRLTPAGEAVFFEANSSPDFTTDEAWTGYPLAAALADCLLRG